MEPRILHGDVVDRLIQTKTAIKGHEYQVCVNGCKLFVNNNTEEHCPHCQQPRYKDRDSTVPRSSIKMMSIGDILAQKLADPETRQLMQYRVNREAEPCCVEDVFDGEHYKNLVSKGYFSNPDDVAIGLFTDGFVNQNKGKSSYTMVHAIIYNFPPSIRYINNSWVTNVETINTSILDIPRNAYFSWRFSRGHRNQRI